MTSSHLCSFETIRSDFEVIQEVCSECHRLVNYKKDWKGRVNNRKYRQDHARDFLQPYDKFYLKYYGQDYHRNQNPREYQERD